MYNYTTSENEVVKNYHTMYCPKKMRLNSFKEMRCPNPKDLYARVGQRMPSNTGSSDGQTYSDVVPFGMSKLDSLSQSMREENMRLMEERDKALQAEQSKPANENEETA